MPQPIVYIEIAATDVVRAATFYHKVFEWIFPEPTSRGYSTFSSGDNGIGGGIYRTDDMRPGGGMVPYIYVTDIELRCESIAAAGGTVVVQKSEIPGTGWYAHFRDTEGNLVGLFTPREE